MKIIKQIAIVVISLILAFLIYDRVNLPPFIKPYAFFMFGVVISLILTFVFFKKELNCYKKLPKNPTEKDLKKFFDCLNS